jgi:hypothetical protein
VEAPEPTLVAVALGGVTGAAIASGVLALIHKVVGRPVARVEYLDIWLGTFLFGMFTLFSILFEPERLRAHIYLEAFVWSLTIVIIYPYLQEQFLETFDPKERKKKDE